MENTEAYPFFTLPDSSVRFARLIIIHPWTPLISLEAVVRWGEQRPLLRLASMLNHRVIVPKPRWKLFGIFDILLRSSWSLQLWLLVPALTRAPPIMRLLNRFWRSLLVLYLFRCCLGVPLLWAPTDVGVVAFLAFFFVHVARSQVNKC